MKGSAIRRWSPGARRGTGTRYGTRNHSVLCSGYLKHFFIQDTGTKDNHAMGVQQWTSTSGERPGDPLLAVNYEGDRLALHSHSHTVPPGHGGSGSRD